MVGPEKEQVPHSAGLGVSGFQKWRQPRRSGSDAAGVGPAVLRPRGLGLARARGTRTPKSPRYPGGAREAVLASRVSDSGPFPAFLFRFSELDP